MKLDQLKEMTMQVGSYEQLAAFLSEFEDLNQPDLWVGDLEEFKVYKRRRDQYTDYGIFKDDKIVGFFVLLKNEVLNAFVVKELRQEGLFSMFLFFLKQNENISQIILGNRHSEEAIEAIKRIYSRFDTYWTDGNQKVPYDPKTIDQYYGPKITKWKIILENYDNFSHIPKNFEFRDARCFYRPLLDYDI